MFQQLKFGWRNQDQEVQLCQNQRQKPLAQSSIEIVA